jgi:hypothetical protein
MSKKRSRAMDPYDGAVDFDENTNEKGGHSLRKRQKVDYSIDFVEDEAAPPSANSKIVTLTRPKKRKVDADENLDGLDAGSLKKRSTDREQLGESALGRRKNPTRRTTTGSKAYAEDMDDSEELDVKDTIEVGVAYENADETKNSDSEKSSEFQDSISSDITPAQLTPKHELPADANARSIQLEEEEGGGDDDEDEDAADSAGMAVEPPSATSIRAENAKLPEGEDAVEDNPHQPPQPEARHRPLRIKIIHNSAFSNRKQDVEPQAPQATEPDEDSEAIKRQLEIADDSNEQPPSSPTVGRATTPITIEAPGPATLDLTLHDKMATIPNDGGAVEMASIKENQEQKTILLEDNVIDEEGRKSHERGGSPKMTMADMSSVQEIEDLRQATALQEGGAEVIDEPPNAADVGHDDESMELNVTWEDLTPYVAGEFVLHPEKLPEPEAPEEDEAEGTNILAKDDADDAAEDTEMADEQPLGRTMPEIEIEDADNNDANNVDPKEFDPGLNRLAVDSGVATPLHISSARASPQLESNVATAASSPAPPGEAEEEDSDEEASPPALSRARFHKFPMLRPVEDFAAVFHNHADMSEEELYAALEFANECLLAWQEEYKSCGEVVDDYENAMRRRQQDAEFDRKTKNLTTYNRVESYIEKDFELKGYRAKEKGENAGNAYLRAQDRIQASAYGFDYDPHPTKVGNQDPALQREGMVTRRMLRNQPRQTARAAEAGDGSDNLVTGKRARKPRELFEGMQDASRSATPVPTKGRRGPRRKTDIEAEAVAQNAESDVAFRTKRGRGGRKKALASDNITPTPSLPGSGGSVATAAEEYQPTKLNARKKGPRAARANEIAFDEIDRAGSAADEATDGGHRPPKRVRGNRQNLALEIPADNISNGPSSAATDATDESRPSTSSSSDTVSTVESSYDFRPKRQRNFREEADEEPPRKRTRRDAKKEEVVATTDTAAPAHTAATKQEPESDFPLGRPTKIVKLKPGRSKLSAIAAQPLSANGSPAPSQPMQEGTESAGEKDYSQMTKSEKMSHSMKSKSSIGCP